MKREDFKIEGIPEGYRVYDVDLTPSGRPVAVLGHGTDRTQPVSVRWHGRDIPLADEALRWHSHLKQLFLMPIVRAAGDDMVVVVEPSALSNDEINARIWRTAGERLAEFHAGDDVQEVLASEDLILLFYGDVGQTDDIRLSHQAMAVISTAGEYLWGHGSQFRKDSFDVWFHAAVWDGTDSVAVFADIRHKCAFARLDLRERRQQVSWPPRPIASPNAVTTLEGRVLLHGAGTDEEGRKFLESLSDPEVQGKMQRDLQGRGLDEALSRQLVEYSTNDPKVQVMLGSDITPDDIVEWWPGESTWRVIGEFPARQLRGLPGGRFIAVQPDGYTILSFD